VQTSNDGWSFRELNGGETVPEPLAIRGYTIEKIAQRELTFDQPGSFVVDDTPQCSIL